MPSLWATVSTPTVVEENNKPHAAPIIPRLLILLCATTKSSGPVSFRM